MAVHHSNFEESMQAAHQGPATQRVAPSRAPTSQQEITMSKLARILAVSALLTVMSLASSAYAQDPGAAPASPTTTQGSSTTTTTRPVAGPKSLPVTVSPQAGVAGRGVTVRADLRGCTRPSSAHGFFQQAHQWNTDGTARRLESERVSQGRWYTGEYFLTERDTAGLGRFGVVCDNAIVGYATFQVRKWPGSMSMALSRRSGRPGTTVRITADIRGGCDPAWVFFQDRNDRANGNTKPATILRVTDRRLVATYTVSSRDAVGRGRFGVSCNMRTDNYRIGYASFRVLAANGGSGGSGGSQTDDSGNTQLPKRIDTGLGGTADGTSQNGLDPVSLLPGAGLLLIVLAAGLWLRQITAGRRP
jgi:hypothetical protein